MYELARVTNNFYEASVVARCPDVHLGKHLVESVAVFDSMLPGYMHSCPAAIYRQSRLFVVAVHNVQDGHKRRTSQTQSDVRRHQILKKWTSCELADVDHYTAIDDTLST